MAKPTYQDATLVLQLAQVSALRRLPLGWLWSEEFDPDYTAFIQQHPPGSEGFHKATGIAVGYELVGTLWKYGLINEDLLFDLYWITGPWERLRDFVYGCRQAFGDPALGENFEALAARAKQWKQERRERKEVSE
jgi:hypothetical protein